MKLRRLLGILCCVLAIACMMTAVAFADSNSTVVPTSETADASGESEGENTRGTSWYTVTVRSNDTGAGVAVYTGLPIVSPGATVTALAVPNVGYRFVGWVAEEVGEITRDNQLRFTVNNNITLTAVFAPVGQYFVFQVVSEVDGGSVQLSPDRETFYPGEKVTAHVTAYEGYRIRGVYYSEDITGQSSLQLISKTPDATFTMPASDIVISGAYFHNEYHTVTVDSGITHGTVRLDGNKTSAKYRHGDPVTVTFVPDDGYQLTGISGIGEDYSFSGNTVTFLMLNKNMTISATFEKIQSYTVNFGVSPAAGGTLTVTKDPETKLVTATAIPYDGYEFVGWYEQGSDELLCDKPVYVFAITHSATVVARFRGAGYRVYVSGQEVNGTVSTAKPYYKPGETVQILATPDEGYMVDKYYWGPLDSTGAGTMSAISGDSFTMPDSIVAISAKFVRAYTITVTGNDGSVTGAGRYKENANVTLQAGEKEGYVFVGWKENGSTISTSATYQFKATANRTLEAVYARICSLTLDGTPENGSISGCGTGKEGDTLTLTATPDAGYHFTGWRIVRPSDNMVITSSRNPLQFMIDDDWKVKAYFAPNQNVITVSANPSTGGMVAGAGTYETGQTVTLTATATEGYNFKCWKKNGTTVAETATYSFTVKDGGEYIAYFETKKFTVSVSANPSTSGTVSGSGTYSYNSIATVKATPVEGYKFVGWLENGTTVSTQAEYSFGVNRARTLVACFEKNVYRVTALVSPPGGGTASGGGYIQHGASTTVKATPSEGYRFVNWTLGGTAVSTQAEYTFTVSADANLVANFAKLTYTVTATLDPANGGTVSGTGTYEWGKTATLKAAPAEGYSFAGWTVNGEVVSIEEEYSFVVKNNASIGAGFEKIVYQLYVLVDPEDAGTVSGNTSCEWGSSITVKANPAQGYVFVGWRENGEIICTSAEYTVALVEDTMIEACFEEAPAVEYTVTYDANGATCSVPAAVTVIEGGTTVIPAVTMTREGHYFLGWATSKTATAAEYKRGNVVTVTGDITLYAVWKKQSFKLTFDANGGNGSVAAISALYGATVTIPKSTITREGHYFMGWAESATATTAQYKTGNTLTLTGAKTLYAVWKKQSFKLTFSANGGKGSVAAITALYGATVTIPKASLTREGYYFMGWAESATATAVQYKTGNTLTLTGAKTLYAVWKAQTRKLTFDANGGTGTLPATVSVAYGTKATVGKGSLSRAGYYFMGWATTKTATAAEYKTNSTIVLTDNVTLYAVWKVQTKKLSFNVNGGTGTLPATVTVNYGETAKVGKASVSREGYYFLGWATTQNATAAQYKTGSEIVMTADTVLYAVWKKK